MSSRAAHPISLPVSHEHASRAFSSVDDAAARLESAGYVSDREIAVAAYLAAALGKPLLL